MKNKTVKRNTILTAGIAVAAAAGLAFGGAALANAADQPTPTPRASAPAAGGGAAPGGASDGNTDPHKPMRSDEQLLTGDTAAKVTAAAKAKEPGATIQRVETDSEGSTKRTWSARTAPPSSSRSTPASR